MSIPIIYINFSSILDLLVSGGRKSSKSKLEAPRISFKTPSPFSTSITSNILPRTSPASPNLRRLPRSSPPSRNNCPISDRGTTFSTTTLPMMCPRNSGALGASFTASSRVDRTDSNLVKQSIKMQLHCRQERHLTQ